MRRAGWTGRVRRRRGRRLREVVLVRRGGIRMGWMYESKNDVCMKFKTKGEHCESCMYPNTSLQGGDLKKGPGPALDISQYLTNS